MASLRHRSFSQPGRANQVIKDCIGHRAPKNDRFGIEHVLAPPEAGVASAINGSEASSSHAINAGVCVANALASPSVFTMSKPFASRCLCTDKRLRTVSSGTALPPEGIGI